MIQGAEQSGDVERSVIRRRIRGAESEAAADVLLGAGIDQVRVLDEGFDVWLARGYPSASGP